MWCKAEFSASLLQSWVSHDHLEIILICWFAAQKHIIIIIIILSMLKTIVQLKKNSICSRIYLQKM